MAYTQLFTHLIFGTYKRQNTLSGANYGRLVRYFNKTLTNKKCIPYEINGTENHLHFLISMHPTICIALLTKDLKPAGTSFIKQELVQPFSGLLGSGLLLFPRVPPVVNAVHPLRGFYFQFILIALSNSQK